MIFANLYRISFYTMLVLSSLVLSVDAGDNPLSMLFPIVVAAAAVLAFITVDRPQSDRPDLLFLPSEPDRGRVPEEGSNLVVVAEVGGAVYVRVFDGDGRIAGETDESAWPDGDARAAELKRLVAGLGPTHELTTADRARLTSAATALIGQPHPSAISDLVLNVLAVGSIGLLFLEYFWNPDLLLLALGHWLVYLQLILMFRPKTVIEDWELFLLGLVQVLVGAVISQSDVVGMMLFSWAVMALWVLGLFSLEREAFRARGNGRVASVAGAGAEELYPGLLNAPFLLSAVRVTLTTLALGGVIFLAMPRRSTMPRTRGVDAATQHLTGFDDEVQLGQLGEILENDSVVMSVEFFDGAGNRLSPDPECLWRGVTMARYENGRWFRQVREAASFPAVSSGRFGSETRGRRGEVRQVIKLESNDSTVLFGLRPMLDASAPRRYGPDLNGIDGTITRGDTRPGTFDYEVLSLRDASRPQPGEAAPKPYMRKTILVGVPEQARERLRAIAERVIESSLPAASRSDAAACARALETYLRDSGQFTYTLKLDVVDRTLDPVEDFLVNRKEGHCEYFASALALLLRSVGIPSRMVNGFKGGDWNEIARIMNVRQKHAHSWVEAYLGNEDGSPQSAPVWLTLDPTPGLERDRSVALVSGFKQNFRQVTDLVRYVWVFYVVGYNADRQNRLLYQPARQLAAEAKRGFGMMGKHLNDAAYRVVALLRFENTRSFVSVRGFVVSFVGLLLLAALVRGLVWLTRRVLRRLRGHDEGSVALADGAAQYRRLAQLLESYDLRRDPEETQDEFARRATAVLTARGSVAGAVADVPGVVVEAFYRVRFGHAELGPAVSTLLDARIDALEASLRASES